MLSTNSYDVDAPEESTPARTAYYNKREVRIIVLVLIAVVALGYPVYIGLMQQRDKLVCSQNMEAMYKGMLMYAAQNGDRLPPLYEVGENGAPNLIDGKPTVWASLLMPHVSKRANFFCPAAHDDEKMPARGHDGRERRDFELTYGMYLPMGTFPYLLAANASDTALILETSNHGALGSYNPYPFRRENGEVVPFDAFMAGFDDSNFELTDESKSVTRLAFRNVSKGYGTPEAKPRHGVGITVFYLDGHKGYLMAPQAEIVNLGGDADGPWRTR